MIAEANKAQAQQPAQWIAPNFQGAVGNGVYIAPSTGTTTTYSANALVTNR